MPTEILNQLKSLREGIAEKLKKDPRYLTLTALDKSIAEISGVLSASGLIPAEHVGAPAPLHFTPDAMAGSAGSAQVAPALAAAAPSAEAETPASSVGSAPIAKAPASTTPALTTPASAADPVADGAASTPVPKPPAAGTGSSEVVKKKKKKKSILKPVIETAAIVGAVALAAEVYSEVKGKPAAKAAAKPDAEAEKGDPDEDSEGAEHEKAEHEEAEAADKDEAADDDAGAHPETEHAAAGIGEAAETAEAEHGEGEHAEAGDTEAAGEPDASPKGKVSGYKAMAARPGATQYQPAISVKFGKLPNKVDLRPLMTPVENQGDTNSCVANAVAGAYEYWIKKASKQDQNISRLFVYYNARWRDGSQDKDEGSVIQLAMEGLSKFGACSEKVWPFDTHLTLKKPGAEAYKDAAAYRVQDMAQVPLKLDAWKQALAEGKPIVFGCALFDSFDQCSAKGGVVPMPAPEDLARDKHSGHSMCAVGYSETEKVFIVRNSWGADWGNKGYCYMPYAYLMNPKFNDGDCWVFVPKVPMQPPREVWSDTTDPVTNDGKGVDFEIETHTIADYEHITVDLFEKIRHPFNATVLSDYSEYVSWASRSMWSELSSFDVATYLASTAALTGVASIAAAAYLSETSTSETSVSETSESVSAMSEESSQETSEESSEETSEDAEDDAAEGDDDDAEGDDDDDAEGDDDDDAEGDDDDDAEGDDDDDAEGDDDDDAEGDDDDDAEGDDDDDAEGDDDDDAEGDDDDDAEGDDDDDAEGDDDDDAEGDDDDDAEGDDDDDAEGDDDDDAEGDDDDDAEGEDDDAAGDDDAGDESAGDDSGDEE